MTALLSWARSLGRLHASTAGREADFNALLRRLGGPAKTDPGGDEPYDRVEEEDES